MYADEYQKLAMEFRTPTANESYALLNLAAEAGEVLADGDSCHELPGWIVAEQYKSVRVKGLGTRSDLMRLGVLDGYRAPLWELPG